MLGWIFSGVSWPFYKENVNGKIEKKRKKVSMPQLWVLLTQVLSLLFLLTFFFPHLCHLLIPLLFLSFSSPYGPNDGEQLQWLENDLRKANSAEHRKKHPWIIVCGHRRKRLSLALCDLHSRTWFLYSLSPSCALIYLALVPCTYVLSLSFSLFLCVHLHCCTWFPWQPCIPLS